VALLPAAGLRSHAQLIRLKDRLRLVLLVLVVLVVVLVVVVLVVLVVVVLVIVVLVVVVSCSSGSALPPFLYMMLVQLVVHQFIYFIFNLASRIVLVALVLTCGLCILYTIPNTDTNTNTNAKNVM
jgi:hypothetical protein